ncbi:MAG TPA: hypothetical protein HA362_00655 [Nanoarchaeota archaeon]|nr:hypothetical protein [Nanoarchaeota archaeon]
MKLTYWMLGVFTFLILALVFFIIYPATAIITGFIAGFIAVYKGFEPAAGTMIIGWSKLTWAYWWASIIAVFVLTVLFLITTKLVEKAKRFRKIKVKPEKKAQQSF